VDLETILEQSMGADAAAASTAKEQAA